RASTAQAFVSWSSTTTPATIAAAARCRWVRRGGRPSPPSFGTRLAVDADVGPRDRLQALDRDLAARVRAHAVGALSDPGERRVDLLHQLAGLGRQQEVALALDADGVALARLLVELGVARLPLAGQLLG